MTVDTIAYTYFIGTTQSDLTAGHHQQALQTVQNIQRVRYNCLIKIKTSTSQCFCYAAVQGQFSLKNSSKVRLR